MAVNLTRAEIEQMQEALLTAEDGTPITALQHRAFNSAMLDFINSFLPTTLAITADGPGDVDGSSGIIQDDKLVKRNVVSIVSVDGNVEITTTGFNKITASDTLTLKNGNSYPIGAQFIINFKQA